MMTERLKTEWLTYQREVIPKNAPMVQLEECRRAFYAGAAALHNLVLTMLEPGVEATEGDVAKMGELNDELLAFGETFKRPQ